MRRPPEQSPEEIDAMWRRGEKKRAYFDSHYADLKQLYPDEFVAVRQGKVIDHDADLGALDDRLRSQRLGVQDVWVEFIRTDWSLIL